MKTVMTRAEALEVLGLTPAANDEDIKAAYRNLSKRVHPDVAGGSAELFRRVQMAYERLVEGPELDDDEPVDAPAAPHDSSSPVAGPMGGSMDSLRWWQLPFLAGLGPTTPKGCLLLLFAAVIGGGFVGSGFPSPVPSVVEFSFFLLAVGRIAALPLRVRRSRRG